MSSLRRLLFALLAGGIAIAVVIAVFLDGLLIRGRPEVHLAFIALLSGVLCLAFGALLLLFYRWVSRHLRRVEELSAEVGRLALGGYRPLPGGDDAVDDLSRSVHALARALEKERETGTHQQALQTAILDGLPEGLLAINRNRRIILANQSARRLFGSEGAPAGSSLLEVVRNTSVLEAFTTALEGESSFRRAKIFAGAEERSVEVRAFPLAEEPRGIAAVALFIDVTAIERLERTRRQFLDDFSHEVRTPLAGLRSAIETLHDGRLRPEQQEELWQIALRQTNRIEVLASDLAELNRIESGEIELDRQPVELYELASELCAELRGRLPAGHARIAVEGERVIVAADRARVEQIVSNLLDNALKYGPDGGEVTVVVADGGTDAVVRVSDQGEGIPPEEHDKIFRRFYRVDRSRAQRPPGTGLGLAITKHLVLAHGGSIGVESEPGRGATFEVRLPKVSGK